MCSSQRTPEIASHCGSRRMEEWKAMTTANRTGGAEHRLVRANALSRRKVLGSSAAALAAGALGSTFVAAAMTGTKSYALGDFSVTIVSDGYLVVPSAFLARNAPRLELEEAMTIAGQRGERVNAPTNITLVRTKSDLILIDTGSGPHFMPTAGKLLEKWRLQASTQGALPKSCTPTVTPIIFGPRLTILTKNPTFQMPVTFYQQQSGIYG